MGRSGSLRGSRGRPGGLRVQGGVGAVVGEGSNNNNHNKELLDVHFDFVEYLQRLTINRITL